MVVLGGAVLRIWHTILFKIDLRPLGLVELLMLCWVCIGVALAFERTARSSEEAGPPHVWGRCGKGFWLMLATFSVLLILFNVGFMRAASDGRGYFAQTRSIVMDHDLDFSNDIATFAAREQDAAFPLGTALLWSPFFVLAHGWLALLNLLGEEHLRNGFTNPYQRAVGLGTLCYGLAAFVMMSAALRRHFDFKASILAVLSTLLATPVVWYLTVESSMSHGASLFAVTAFLSLWLAFRHGAIAARWWLLAAAAILMILVRPQNALFLLAPAGDFAARRWRGTSPDGAGDREAVGRRTALALIAIVVLAAGAVVMLGGSMLEYAGGQGLLREFSPVHLLFSPLHGLISSSPVVIVALLGLALLFRTDRGLALGFGLVVISQVLLNSVTPGWAGGASFGARRFVACAMPFAFGLAAAIQAGRKRPLVPISILLGSFMVANLVLVDEVRRSRITLSDPVPFESVMRAISARFGNPFALPGAAMFALRHDVPITMLDRAPTRRHRRMDLDVGGRDDEKYLADGWSGREIGGGRSFRWAAGPEAGLLVRLVDRPFVLSFVAAPFLVPDAGPQIVRVQVEDRLLGTFVLSEGFTRYQVDVPAEILPARDWTRVRFQFGYSGSPAELGISNDRRQLAVQFDSIRLEPH